MLSGRDAFVNNQESGRSREGRPVGRLRPVWTASFVAILKAEGGGMAMPAADGELRIPTALRSLVGEVVAITDRVCLEHLDAEYAELCRRLVAKLARKRPSPLERGALRTWAAGAIYAVGSNNFLFDPSEIPHLTADRLSELLGVPKSTMAGKAKRIRDALGLEAYADVEFCRRELLADHPFAWLVQVDGVIVDARQLPAELQAEARRRRLIPDLSLTEAA